MGYGSFARALVVTTALACTAKVYPEAQPEVAAASEADSVGTEGTELATDAGGTRSSADAGSTERGANPGSNVAAEPEPVPDAGCTPVPLFRDRDGDGYGSAAPEDFIQDCPPIDGFVTNDTDCHDAEHTGRDPARDVFPGQTAFFTVGYQTANGVSFDYDCSGHEEADPDNDFVPAPTNCEERMPPLCGSDLGYVLPADARGGDGVDPLCGERRLGLCNASGGGMCGLNVLTAGAPFPCR